MILKRFFIPFLILLFGISTIVWLTKYQVAASHWKAGRIALEQFDFEGASKAFAAGNIEAPLFARKIDFEKQIEAREAQLVDQARRELDHGNLSHARTLLSRIPKDSPAAFESASVLEEINRVDPLKVRLALDEDVREQKRELFKLAADAFPVLAVRWVSSLSPFDNCGATLFDFNKEDREWEVIGRIYPSNCEMLEISGEELLAGNGAKELLAVSATCGSGGCYYTAKVFAIEGEREKLVFHADDVGPGGRIRVQEGRLIVGNQEAVTTYAWNGRKFVGRKEPALTQVPADARVVEYWGDKGGFAHAFPTEIKLRMGERMGLRRRGPYFAERIMTHESNVLVKSGSGFLAVEKGEQTFTIVPNYADWEKAVKVKVVVLP